MSSGLIREAKKVLAGKAGRLEDEELGYARAYAAGPSLGRALLLHKPIGQCFHKIDQIGFFLIA